MSKPIPYIMKVYSWIASHLLCRIDIDVNNNNNADNNSITVQGGLSISFCHFLLLSCWCNPCGLCLTRKLSKSIKCFVDTDLWAPFFCENKYKTIYMIIASWIVVWINIYLNQFWKPCRVMIALLSLSFT